MFFLYIYRFYYKHVNKPLIIYTIVLTSGESKCFQVAFDLVNTLVVTCARRDCLWYCIVLSHDKF